jgi:hypothetical protein
MYRKCIDCGTEATTKDALENFATNKQAKYGVKNICKQCHANRSSVRHAKNREHLNAYKRQYYKNNIAMFYAKNAKRRGMQLNATPSWADHDEIKSMYQEALYHNMEVDHIVPLNNPKVCGLHWEGNLQLLSREDNRAKSNKLVEVDY